MIVKYRHWEDPETIKIYDSDLDYYALQTIFESSKTKKEFADFQLQKFEKKKASGIILEYAIITKEEAKAIKETKTN